MGSSWSHRVGSKSPDNHKPSERFGTFSETVKNIFLVDFFLPSVCIAILKKSVLGRSNSCPQKNKSLSNQSSDRSDWIWTAGISQKRTIFPIRSIMSFQTLALIVFQPLWCPQKLETEYVFFCVCVNYCCSIFITTIFSPVKLDKTARTNYCQFIFLTKNDHSY